MQFSILLLLTLGFNACPALAQEGKDHNERALSAPIKGPLRQSRNPNYFQDARGTPLILCGSQTWNTLQDWGSKGAVRPLDFDAFVSFSDISCAIHANSIWPTSLPAALSARHTIVLPKPHPSARSTWLTRLPEAHSRWTSRPCPTHGSWRSNGSTPRPERQLPKVR